MKRTIIMTFALLAATFLSCNKTETVSSGEVTVNYAVTIPATKAASGSGEAVNYVWYALYRQDGTLVNEYPLQRFEGKALCPVTMVRDQSYKVVFVAQHYSVDGQTKTPAYAVDAQNATLAMPVAPVANSADYDLFCFVEEVTDYQGDSESSPVTLTRTVAQVNFCCTQADADAAGTLGMYPTHSGITLTGVPASYDILAASPSEETLTVSYEKAALTGEDNLLGTAFCFAGDNLTAGLRLYKEEGLTTDLDVENVPVEVNRRTNITGAFMTGTVDYAISIDVEDAGSIHHPLN